MEGVIFGLVVLFWIGERIVRFFQWIGREARGLNKALPPAQPIMAAPTPMPAREELRTISRPAGDDEPVAPELASRASFIRRERELARLQDTVISASRNADVSVRTAPPALQTLFSQPDDLLRAFIMREVLEQPRRIQTFVPPSHDTNLPASSGT